MQIEPDVEHARDAPHEASRTAASSFLFTCPLRKTHPSFTETSMSPGASSIISRREASRRISRSISSSDWMNARMRIRTAPIHEPAAAHDGYAVDSSRP